MNAHIEHVEQAQKLLRSCAYRHDLYELFSDCMECIALSLSNAVDLRNREERERRFLEIVGRYGDDVIEIFAKVFAHVTMALEAEPGDALGTMFGALELHSKARGQFFTPYTVCQFMAKAIIVDDEKLRSIIKQHGFVTAMEPACGAGAIVIATADAMRECGINYQQHLHVTAIDIDRRAVHMTYIQLSLLHAPAIVIHGNSLSGEIEERWYTPAHIIGGWGPRIAERLRVKDAGASKNLDHEIRQAPVMLPSSPPAFRPGEQLSLF